MSKSIIADMLRLSVDHKPEAENDFVTVSFDGEERCDTKFTAHLHPDLAVWLAKELLVYAEAAAIANERYKRGRGY